MSSKYDDNDVAESKSGNATSKSEHKDAKGDKETGAKDTQISGDELLNKVQEFFFTDENLTTSFEMFVEEKSIIFDASADVEEYKLEYTDVYHQYKALFEEKIETYITKTLGSSIFEFYDVLQKKTEEDENSNDALFGQIMLAVTDFSVFMQMMREGAQARAEGRLKYSKK
jgi:hypothetical protein